MASEIGVASVKSTSKSIFPYNDTKMSEGLASHQFHSSIFIVIVEYHAGSFDDVVACDGCDRWFHHQRVGFGTSHVPPL